MQSLQYCSSKNIVIPTNIYKVNQKTSLKKNNFKSVGMTLAKVKKQDGMTLAKVKEQDGMTLAKVRHAQVIHANPTLASYPGHTPLDY